MFAGTGAVFGALSVAFETGIVMASVVGLALSATGAAAAATGAATAAAAG